jgi:hypothetical protein
MSLMTYFVSRSGVKVLVLMAAYPLACIAQSKPDCSELPDAAPSKHASTCGPPGSL